MEAGNGLHFAFLARLNVSSGTVKVTSCYVMMMAGSTMQRLVAVLLFVNSCNCGSDPLNQALGGPCYTDADGQLIEVKIDSPDYEALNEGACSTGSLAREGAALICRGEAKPQQEICDGIDDDCNGYVDDAYFQPGVPLQLERQNPENFCVTTGVCEYSAQICLDGAWTCLNPPTYGAEICDGLDNDCDGKTDEDTPEEPLFSPQDRFVYEGDPGTINVGECRAGYKECIGGETYIRGMRTPVAEICGNDDDDDCDGLVDEQDSDQITLDYVFVVDFSGSMEQFIDSLADSLCLWSAQGRLQSSSFAVIAIGYRGPEADGSDTALLTDFTDAAAACSVIQERNVPQNFGNSEYQIDAIFHSWTPGSNTFLSWRDDGNTKRVFVFSDESLQQLIASSLPEALEMVVQQCLANDYAIGAFVAYEALNQPLWVELTQRCNGFLDYLTEDTEEMVDKLNYWVGSSCDP